MKIVSWNVRGIGARLKRAVVKDLLCRANPDIVILQETKLDSIDRRLVKSIWSSKRIGWMALDAQGSAGGILLMWREDRVTIKDSLLGRFSVSIECNLNGSTEGWISGVYGPCSSYGRKDFWRELYDLAGLC